MEQLKFAFVISKGSSVSGLEEGQLAAWPSRVLLRPR